jgi:hypothetical protein
MKYFYKIGSACILYETRPKSSLGNRLPPGFHPTPPDRLFPLYFVIVPMMGMMRRAILPFVDEKKKESRKFIVLPE